MGALDEGHFCEELEKGVELEDPETLAIEGAVRVLLQGLGEDVAREGIRKTPLRVAKAFREGTRGYQQKVKDIIQGALFPEAGLDKSIGNAGGAGGLVVVRDLNLFSYCETCLLPFQVKCHVGYVPSGQRVVGLSKLSRVSDVFAKRLQEPQRLAGEICSALQDGIKPSGVAVVLQCSHLRFPTLDSLLLNSNNEVWSEILVMSGSGVFKDEENSECWTDFMSLLKLRVLKIEKSQTSDCWCPSQSSASPSCMECSGFMANPLMVSAVTKIIESIGEDPLRNELSGTPVRFVQWLMNFKETKFDLKLNGLGCKVQSYTEDESTIHSEMNLSFWSQCEHHLLPFHGVIHVGYFCAQGFNLLPKTLLQSVVHFFGFKLQVQERLTRQIAETVSSFVGGDVVVVVEAYHTCMISRGIEKSGSSTATIAVLGRFSTDGSSRAKFLEGIPSSTGDHKI
ncbi:hypothetical protein SAY87_004358 [Trapa incisa]|uniref:GTP cyclohydrolase 1 n=1 Tax=Trapa incisa TaxID=236973 RepID=A0AAN7JNQ1_9MYRT|nr:hypothetical protein SAY87_004358 [Trapa incisa]